MTKQTKRAGKQSADSAEKTKQDILSAATSLFANKGYEATSLREVAKEAGLTHGIIRHHFGSKFEIWKAISQAVLEQYAEKMLPIIIEASQSNDPLASLKQVVTTFIQVTTEHPDLVQLAAREGNQKTERSDYFRDQFELLHGQISTLFERAKKDCPRLQSHTNDSFFLFLLSLTAFPLMLPVTSELLPIADSNNPKFNKERERLILDTLF